MKEPIHYIIVRRDIPFGTALAMTAHAAADSMEEYIASLNLMWSAPPHDPMTAVVLGVDSKEELQKVSEALYTLLIPHHKVIEHGPIWQNEFMAIGVFPGERERLSPAFSQLTTYKEPLHEVSNTSCLGVATVNAFQPSAQLQRTE
jgi:peptidyl-tRNA hydrolase